jgi:beta-xylosidase
VSLRPELRALASRAVSIRRRIPTLVLLGALIADPAAAQPTYSNPTLPGDYPDPSVIRVGGDYWATATTSQWAPLFPLLHSRDLVNWEQVGAVFDTPPAWSAGSYWAPEIQQFGGRFFVYYTARRKGGPLCVAVASAASAAGPWQDHGPLVCQAAGSIDAFAVDDERGRRHLVWKEDGNSRKQPTPLWAQPLSPDGTRLVGTPREILRNAAPWEAHLIEGPFILRRNGWFYLFYSADACCGRNCNYKLGVARARALLGPWERAPQNPILAGNDAWKCPGHGSIVSTPEGRDFLLYHAYHAEDFQFAGRQGLLDEVVWGEDGWPSINRGRGPGGTAAAPLGVSADATRPVFHDELAGPSLQPGWQWPWERRPARRFEAGALVLKASGTAAAGAVDAVVARPTLTGNYAAATRVLTGTGATGGAGLAAYGDTDNAIGMSFTGRAVEVWMREKGTQRTLASAPVTAGPSLDLRLEAIEGRRFRFAYSLDGRRWTSIGDETEGGYLPPWDRAVRVALVVGGAAGAEGRFDWLRVETR